MTEPREMQPIKGAFMEFLVMQAICKGYVLAPEAAEPWRWGQWWDPILKLGAARGDAFQKGLQKASASSNNLNLRAKVGGDSKVTALKSVCALLHVSAQVDLRDNRLGDDDALLLGAAIETSPKITQLILSGNRFTAAAAKPLCDSAWASESRIQMLDLSRNRQLCSGPHVDEMISAVGALNSKLAFVNLASLNMPDDVGAKLFKAFTLPAGTKSVLTKLDVSRNALGALSAASLASLFESCPSLSLLDLSRNELGVTGGKAVAAALPRSTSLKTLDLSQTNLCHCTPIKPTAMRADWNGEAIVALAGALPECEKLGEIFLHSNGLCGMWTESICGDVVPRGTYTAAAIDSLLVMFSQDKRVPITKSGLHVEAGNFIRIVDKERLQKALKDNSLKATKKDTSAFEKNMLSMMDSDDKKDDKSGGAAQESLDPAAEAEDGDPAPIELDISLGQQTAAQIRARAGVKGGSGAPVDVAVIKELSAPSFKKKGGLDDAEEDDAKNNEDDKDADWRLRRDAELKAEEAANERQDKARQREEERKKKDDERAEEKLAVQEQRGTSGGGKPAKGMKIAADKAKEGKKKAPPQSSGSGLTPRTAKTKGQEGGTGLTPRSSKNIDADSGAGDAPSKKEAASRGYGQAAGKGKKKKVVEAVVEEAPNPFRDAPLMVAMTNLVARKEVAPNSPLIDNNPKVPAGALMRVASTEVLTDNARGKTSSEHRMYVALDGDIEALGWVTGITKDETENLKLASAGFPLMVVSKALACRDGVENDSKKLDDIPKKQMVRVMETQMMPDGTEKALVAKDQPVAEPIGWVVFRKEGSDAKALDPAPLLQITFDLKTHTANALSRALGRTKEPPKRKKNEATALPFQLPGRRPITRPEDGPGASRHRLVDAPASSMLIFNCFQAQFEVTSWTGTEPFEKLSGESSFDLISKTSRKRLGRVGLAKELGQPFLERVEFPDDWLPCEDHGVVHDGWQGSGILDLELTWNKQVATIRVVPWLSYGCSVGARFCIRKLGAAEGQCATIQRILGDDRVVARVDGYSKFDGVKGETIIDLQPATVVRTTFVGYPRDTKILILHNGKLVDGQVLLWLGSTDHMEGSRHMVNIKAAGSSTGSHAWYDLNMFNHVAMEGGMNAELFEVQRNKYCNFLMSTEDKVEDAITGNHLNIKDQLIFMEAYNVPNGCNPPDYMNLADVPALVKLLVVNSPKRANGTHLAQPVLCRAGPGTGKTWMVKQCLFLLAEILGSDNPGDGIRLVPIIVFVQRIVRLLNELGDNPTELLKDPNGMMRWYIGCQFQDQEKQLLLQAFEMRSMVILVDGVDEAAGMREIVEAFVHYELVTSGNRLVVTSRPEGVDLDDYKTRFVVMNLLELSQEQQRNVIQMQLQGNAFFEHLVNIAECRKELDAAYQFLFKSEALRGDIENLEWSLEAAEAAKAEAGDEKAEGNEGEGGDDTAAKERERRSSTEEMEKEAKKKRGSTEDSSGADDAAKKDAKAEEVVLKPMVRRRLAMDNQQEMQEFMQKAGTMRARLRSNFLDTLNQCMTKKAAVFTSFLEQLDLEIKNLPSPCTRAHLSPAIALLADAQPGKSFDKDSTEVNAQMRETLVQLGLQRKLPTSGGRRGAKAAPIPAFGLWYQVVQQTDESYLAVERYVPVMMYVLGSLAAAVGIRDLALQVDESTGRPIPGSEKAQPSLTYRDPVELWLASTYAGATEPTERPPEPWVASALMRCDTGEQCLGLMRRLVAGVEIAVGTEAATFAMLGLKNAFNPEFHHPTHLRNASCTMKLTFRGASIVVNVQVEHREMLKTFEDAQYIQHNEYFWQRMLNLSEEVYDQKFEVLLLFLVEAIGVPVLLSLLLLTYSNTTGGEVIDLDELPEGRLQLYKLGIMSGIKKRLLITIASLSAGASSAAADAKAGAAEEEAAAAESRPKRERRKGALEQSLGSSGPAMGAGGGGQTEVKVTKHANANEPVLDLNSILRGKKVRVVTGEDDVAEAYSLVVRVLDKSKQPGFDLRSGIVAVVPKSHTMHAIVTALVEYVLAPMAINEAALFETGKKMLRAVAVNNQENGRREFTSKHVACALGASPEELGLWSRLDLDYDHGVALTATLAKQSDKAPAQYQFKHLSFQEGLYAEHLLLLVTSLTPPNGAGWPGWSTDKTAAEFLNNRYMNNTCRIAAGHLGALLAKQRPEWDFRQFPLTPNGRSALWYVTLDNDEVRTINVSNNDVGSDDVPGISKTVATCSNLQKLDLSENELVKLTVVPTEWSMMCEAFSNNDTLTDLNLNKNRLGPIGVRTAARALRNCSGLKRLGFSFNEPGVEHSLAELLKLHPGLESVELVEALDRHLPSRSKDDIGRALLENKAKTLGYLHCDTFVLAEETTHLTWPKEASTSDAVLLAGVLVTNTTLTTFNIGSGASLANTARSALGEALLNNPGSRVAFCNDFGLAPKVDTCEFDLSRTELKDVEPFRLLAGCLRGNRTLTHVTLRQLRMEQIDTLALALRGNSTLAQLDIIHTTRLGGESIVRLPVPELNGSHISGTASSVDLSKTCIEGAIGRVACAMIGTLTAANTSLECLDLSNTGLGLAIGTEGEGGHILLRPMCESKIGVLNELILNNIQLNDKAGAKLFSALAVGLSKPDSGYDKITSLHIANNDLGKGSAAALKQLLWGERAPCLLKSLDLSGNVGLDGYDTALAVKRNESLTSLDFRNIPSANTEEIYSFLGSFLLQDECTCRLGLLSCDAFEVVPGQEELILQPPKPAEGGDAASEPGTQNRPGVMSMLAGVLKFNNTLKTVTLSNTGIDDTSGAFFATSLLENKTLQAFDISNNPIGTEGMAVLAAAAREHPALVSLKTDGAALPIAQLRGSKGADGNIDFTDSGFGALSGHAIGTIVAHNRSLLNLNLKSNKLGADGIAAVVRGLGDAPLRALDVTRNGLGGQGGLGSEIKALSESICRHLGALVDLRMDENDLDCPSAGLAPLCRLRSLRVLSWEKNRLSELPPLIGTMLSLRKLLLHSNQIMELPVSLCLLTSLETLDVHKNMITSLPVGIGNMKSLQKFDLSENKLTELPITICELFDDLQLSVGRNPLEKPSVEQARQGIGAIRRFFGWSKKKDEGDASTEEKIPNAKDLENGDGQHLEFKPPLRIEGGSSRHDWAGPGAVTLLFNCFGCKVREVEGGSDLTTIPGDESFDLVAAFNLQSIGRVKEASSHGQSFAQRLEFFNDWWPWKHQDVDPTAGPPAMVIQLRWKVMGAGRNSASFVVTPWLAYGCSVGARVSTESGFATVCAIKDDDTVEVIRDNVKEGMRPEALDPRPDTVSRTTSPSYKAGQKLLLLLDGVPCDAVVDEWLGVRRGSRHRIRLLSKREESVDTPALKAGKGGGVQPAPGGGRLKGDASFKGKLDAGKDKELIEVDLNENNHAKLLFPTVVKYEDTRAAYCDKLLAGKHTSVKDESTQRDLKVAEQRLNAKAFEIVRISTEEASAAGANESSAAKAENEDSFRDGDESFVAKPAAPKFTTLEREVADAVPSSLSDVIDGIIQPMSGRTSKPASVLIRCKSKHEHDLLTNKTLHALAARLRDPAPKLGPIRLIPIVFSIAKLNELAADEATAKQGVRAMMVKAFELEYPGMADMLRQAMDMRAVVVVCECRDEAELNGLKEPTLEELRSHRLILTVSGAGSGDKVLSIPDPVADVCDSLMQLCSLGLYFNEQKLSDRLLVNLFRRVRAAKQEDTSYYHLVRKLHVASSEVGRAAMEELTGMLTAEDSTLQSLDLSFTQVDGWALVNALKANTSLTSLNLTAVPKIETMYENISKLLAAKDAKTRLGYLQCEAFDLEEGARVLSLREEPISPVAMRLLASLLKHNTTLQELDLTACDIEKEGASALAAMLEFNQTIMKLSMAYNPALDELAKLGLAEAAAKFRPTMVLDL